MSKLPFTIDQRFQPASVTTSLPTLRRVVRNAGAARAAAHAAKMRRMKALAATGLVTAFVVALPLAVIAGAAMGKALEPKHVVTFELAADFWGERYILDSGLTYLDCKAAIKAGIAAIQLDDTHKIAPPAGTRFRCLIEE